MKALISLRRDNVRFATAAAVATLHIPAIYRPRPDEAAEYDRQVDHWLAQQRVARLSDTRPESQILSPTATGWSPIPSNVFADELLDWDVAIEAAPIRPCGTLAARLEYAGRATPTPTTEPWD